MRKIKIVVPIYEDYDAFSILKDNIKKYLFMYNNNITFIVVDDSKTEFIKYLINESRLNDRVRYLRGAGNYGDSLIKGMLRSDELDKLIIMDVDHPFDLIPNMISMLDKYDMVIGNDLNGNNERKVTKLLLTHFLDITGIPHPTCGFMGFNKEIVGNQCKTNKTISFYLAGSNRDMVHVEFLLMCLKKKLSVGILDFTTQNTDIKHNYSMKRNLRWLYDLSIITFRNLIGDYE